MTAAVRKLEPVTERPPEAVFAAARALAHLAADLHLARKTQSLPDLTGGRDTR